MFQKKKKQTPTSDPVITARHPNAKLPEKHFVWTARMYDRYGLLSEVDFVIIHGGEIHSASDAETGEIVDFSKLKLIKKNAMNRVWNPKLMHELFKLYS